MTGPFATRLFRITFAAAGCYNLAFGLWAAVWPLAFFDHFNITPPRYPEIWACIGMIVGVYGLLYLHAAWKLETAWPIIAVGLLGKILGPIGMVNSFSDDWPRRLGMLCVFNDLIWWLPFGLFLVRGTSLARWLERRAPWLCVAFHVAALAITCVALRKGLMSRPDPAARAQFIAAHYHVWSLGWCAWMASAASLVGFYAWWASRLPVRQAFQPDTSITYAEGQAGKPDVQSTLAIAAVLITAAGMICDFTGESLLALPLVETAIAHSNFDQFTSLERAFVLLSAGAANGLYTLGGMILTIMSTNLPTWIRVCMWITWLAGAAMTVAAVADHLPGMAISTIVLFPLLLIWVAWMGPLEAELRRVIVLGGSGLFGRTAAELLRKLGLHVQTASRSGQTDLRIDANDPQTIRAIVQPGNIVLDAAGPYHRRSTALISTAIEIGFDVVDLNDNLNYAESIASLDTQITSAGIRVLTSASTVSAFSTAVMQIIGMESPRCFSSFLVPATRHTANTGTALSLLRTIGEPIRVLRDGKLQTIIGWQESRSIVLPSPLPTIHGRVFESADALWLPRVCPSLRDVAMYVDANVFGANAMLSIAARSKAARTLVERCVSFGTAITRRFGSSTGGVAYELEGYEGRTARFALIARRNSYIVAIAPAVLAVHKIASDQMTERGLVLPNRYVDAVEMLRYLDSAGVEYVSQPGEL